MDIKEYRRLLDLEIAQAETDLATPRWPAEFELAGVTERLGDPKGGAADLPSLGDLLTDATVDGAVRALALEEMVLRTALEDAHTAPLERLGDEAEAPEVRAAAVSLLEQLRFGSPVKASWRADFMRALRTASGPETVESLRLQALESLVVLGDRDVQDELLGGLADATDGALPAAIGLRLLALDAHSGVLDAARNVAQNPPDADALEEAVRLLAGDPKSAGLLAGILEDPDAPTDLRMLAATSLASADEKAFLLSADGSALADATPEHLARHLESLRAHVGSGA